MPSPVIVNPYYKISPNFCYYELIKSDTASRLEIDNEVYDQEIIDRAAFVAENVLEKVREAFGSFTPNSWFRCEQLEFTICKKSWWKRACRDHPSLNPANIDQMYWMAISHSDHPLHTHWKDYFNRKQHPKGASVDFEHLAVANDKLFAWCKENLSFDQLIREFPKPGDPRSGWVHCSSLVSDNRQQSFTIG